VTTTRTVRTGKSKGKNKSVPTESQSDVSPAQPLLAPHSVEVEEAFLGAILIDSDALGIINQISELSPDDFFILRNQWVYEAIQALYQRRSQVDMLLVIEELKARDRLEEIGGNAYLTYLINQTPSSLYAEAYGKQVRYLAVRRRVLEAASDIASLAYGDIETPQLCKAASEKMLQATTGLQPVHTQRMDTVMSVYFDHLAQLYDQPKGEVNINLTGVRTGFADLDVLLGGMEGRTLNILGGRPGMGKTGFALNVAVNAARQGARVFYASMEMATIKLVERIVAAEIAIDSRRLRSGDLTEAQWDRFVSSTLGLGQLDLYFDDTRSWYVEEFVAYLHRIPTPDLMIVDYLQLMRARKSKPTQRETVTYVTRMILDQIAFGLDIPVLAVSQLSRSPENRKSKVPILSDIKESGDIEQDADKVMFIYRDEVYHEDTTRPNIADIIVAKNRSGPTGTASLYYRESQCRFDNLQRVCMNDVDLTDYTKHWSEINE
jgi:replicative DNA helicase